MGFSISWVAFNAVPQSEALAIAGLRATGVVQDIPAAPFQAAELPTGWTVLFANDPLFAEPDHLRTLSRHHALLGCIVEEHAMVSMSSFYTRGECFWEVVSDQNAPSSSLLVSGSPPPEFAALRKRSSHPDTDFNLPIDLAEAVCGFRHGETRFTWGIPSFTVATPA